VRRTKGTSTTAPTSGLRSRYWWSQCLSPRNRLASGMSSERRMRVIRGIDCSGEARGHCALPIADLAAALRWRILLLAAPRIHQQAVGRYMGLATRYVAEFEAKWLRDHVPTDPPLLGSPDLQSLADLANAISVVKGMRWCHDWSPPADHDDARGSRAARAAVAIPVPRRGTDAEVLLEAGRVLMLIIMA
jgi:hypothetical protein